ncbi:MAG TPA: hypothetical protein VMY35_08945 [Phycisphaerae bacterium]|nr:hypothetical protein [Phycisphaerae bacterium]
MNRCLICGVDLSTAPATDMYCRRHEPQHSRLYNQAEMDDLRRLLAAAKNDRDAEWCMALIAHCTTGQIEAVTRAVNSGDAAKAVARARKERSDE